MMKTVKLPNIEKHVESVTVLEWLKREGDLVEKGETLARLEAENAFVEIESSTAGRLDKILAPAETTLQAGGELARIEESDPEPETEAKTATKPLAEPKADASSRASEPDREPESDASPRVNDGEIGEAGEVIPVLMPQASLSMEEGTIAKWRVAPGDQITQGQIIYEVETDKALIEVEADHAGRLARIVAEEDDIVAVNEPVAYLAQNDADVDAYLAAHGSAAAQASDEKPSASATMTALAARETPRAPSPTTESGRVKASPAARRLAQELGVDLSAVGAGRGPGGRIVSDDVREARASVSSAGPTRRAMSPMRRAIARTLLASKQNVPHFYMSQTMDADPMLRFYREKKAEFPCSVNDVIVMACGRTLNEFPAFRSRVEGKEIVELPDANIGVAVGMDDGLVVPVILNAGRLSFERLAAESRRVIETARAGGIIEGMGQGVFTITNLGMFGVDSFSAIINPPEAAILAVGAAREEVVVENGAMRPGRVVTLTLSCDHRVIDGLAAARFLSRLKEILENPGNS